jgi:hypothetical protein
VIQLLEEQGDAAAAKRAAQALDASQSS